MKKKKWAGLVCCALVFSTVLGGCAKKEDAVKTSANASAAKEYVYKIDTLDFKELNMDNVSNVFYYEDKIVAFGYRWETENTAAEEDGTESETEVTIEPREEAGESGTDETDAADETEESIEDDIALTEADMAMLYAEEVAYSVQREYMFCATYDYEGNQLSYNETELEENTWIGECAQGVDEDAFYCIMGSYFEDNSDPDNYIWEEHRSLVKKNLDGTDVWTISLDEYAPEGESVYTNGLLCDKEGQLIVFLNTGKVLVYAKDSTKIKELDIGEDSMGSALLSGTGKVLMTFWGEQGQCIKELNMETGELSEQYKVPGNSYNYSYYGGYGYDLYLTGSGSLYGYNLGDTEVKELMNYVDSDLDSDSLYSIYGVSDTQFYARFYSYSDGESKWGRFTKVDPADVKEKQILTLACNYIDYGVRKQVVNFNKNNDTYRIQIKDYSIYNTEDDYTQSYTRLNTDIVSGNIPDILQLNTSIPVESYIAKGLFEDLYPYIDSDREISRDDLLINVMDVFSTDGKLYKLVPSFSVMTVAGKTADVGEETGWTLDDLNALLASKPEGTEAFYDCIRSSVLSNWMQMSSEQFINWETGECSFDSEGFVKLLEFMKQFPESWDDEKFQDENYWGGYASVYRDGKALLSLCYLSDFASYNRMEEGNFGEEITMIGFPAENKKGSAYDYTMSFAMSSKSANKEGAWEFLRYFLSYEYQKDIWGFPTNAKCYEELKEKAKQRPYYLDENDNKVEYDDTYYVDGIEIIIPPMTDEKIQKVEDFIFSIDQTVVYDEDLINIITEEAEGFFSGQKSAEEVAAIIQSRAKIYVNENR